MDGEVRIRNYYNDFQQNHHNYSNKQDFEWERENNEDFESKHYFQMWQRRQVAEDLQFPVKVCGSYSNRVEWFGNHLDLLIFDPLFFA